MNTPKIIFLTVLVCIGIPMQAASAATIPAGTIILVRTEKNIYSGDSAGRRFETRLARPLAAQGSVAVPSGTTAWGKVKSPRVSVGSTTRPLTLRLTELVIHGKTVPIKTDDFEASNTSPWYTARGVHVTAGRFLMPPGTILQFRLTEAVSL